MSWPPERLRWAVELLSVGPDDDVLEIGCGRGIAAEMICEQLVDGRFLGVDRSASAIAAAVARNAEHVETGTAIFLERPFETMNPAHGTFDKVFAVNVNAFWVSPAQQQLALVASLLRPGASVLLVYEEPSPGGLQGLEDKLLAHLGQAGFQCSAQQGRAPESNLLAVSAQHD